MTSERTRVRVIQVITLVILAAAGAWYATALLGGDDFAEVRADLEESFADPGRRPSPAAVEAYMITTGLGRDASEPTFPLPDGYRVEAFQVTTTGAVDLRVRGASTCAEVLYRDDADAVDVTRC